MTEPEFLQRIKHAAQSLRGPEPGEALLARILEDRKNGLRVALTAGTGRRRWPAVTGIAAAIAAGLVVWVASGRPGLSSQPVIAPPESASLAEFAAEIGLWPDQLYAQASTASRLPRIPILDGSLLRAGLLVYSVRTTYEDGRVLTERSDSVSIGKGFYQDRPAWLLIKEWNYPAPTITQVDTSWFTRDSLRPIARRSRLRAGPTLHTTFTGDSAVRIWRQADGEIERVAVPLPSPPLWDGGAVLSPTELWPLFLTTYLNPTWKGSFPGTGIGNNHELVTFWFDLQVVREERVTVPAGTFDCWKVSELTGGHRFYWYWVDKASGLIVKEGNEPSLRVSRELASYTPRE